MTKSKNLKINAEDKDRNTTEEGGSSSVDKWRVDEKKNAITDVKMREIKGRGIVGFQLTITHNMFPQAGSITRDYYRVCQGWSTNLFLQLKDTHKPVITYKDTDMQNKHLKSSGCGRQGP